MDQKQVNSGHIIAKIQYFGDAINVLIREKEDYLLRTYNVSEENAMSIKAQIIVLKEILERYDEIFTNILFKDDI